MTRVIVTAIHTRDAHAVSKVVRRRLLIGHVKAYANADASRCIAMLSQLASVSQVVSNIRALMKSFAKRSDAAARSALIRCQAVEDGARIGALAGRTFTPRSVWGRLQ